MEKKLQEKGYGSHIHRKGSRNRPLGRWAEYANRNRDETIQNSAPKMAVRDADHDCIKEPDAVVSGQGLRQDESTGVSKG